MHVSCMIHAQVYHSMGGACMEGTPDTVNNNFGSKNPEQLQGTAAQIFSNFCEVCSSVAITVELVQLCCWPQAKLLTYVRVIRMAT